MCLYFSVKLASYVWGFAKKIYIFRVREKKCKSNWCETWEKRAVLVVWANPRKNVRSTLLSFSVCVSSFSLHFAQRLTDSFEHTFQLNNCVDENTSARALVCVCSCADTRLNAKLLGLLLGRVLTILLKSYYLG